MQDGKAIREWDQTAEMLAMIANTMGSGGNRKSFYFHPYGAEIQQAFLDNLELDEVEVAGSKKDAEDDDLW